MTTETVDQTSFASGAVRSADAKDVRFDLISPIALPVLGWVAHPALLAIEDESPEEMIGFALAHIYSFLSGERDPEALGSAAIGVLAAIHLESGGVLPEAGDLGEPGDRLDLVFMLGIESVARANAVGSVKYGDFNWEKGMPCHDILNHAIRHLHHWLTGDDSDDHLGHAAWNLVAAIHSFHMWPEINSGHLREPGCKPPVKPLDAIKAEFIRSYGLRLGDPIEAEVIAFEAGYRNEPIAWTPEMIKAYSEAAFGPGVMVHPTKPNTFTIFPETVGPAVHDAADVEAMVGFTQEQVNQILRETVSELEANGPKFIGVCVPFKIEGEIPIATLPDSSTTPSTVPTLHLGEADSGQGFPSDAALDNIAHEVGRMVSGVGKVRQSVITAVTNDDCDVAVELVVQGDWADTLDRLKRRTCLIGPIVRLMIHQHSPCVLHVEFTVRTSRPGRWTPMPRVNEAAFYRP